MHTYTRIYTYKKHTKYKKNTKLAEIPLKSTIIVMDV